MDRWRKKGGKCLIKRQEAGKYKMSYQNIVDTFIYMDILYTYIFVYMYFGKYIYDSII